ncbi:hypothetical protein RH858_16010 [Halalkaliarchaeum sp. AArc-GB]|uniref:DUF7344 domain-containing protein n=1 Tax=Halalkaliarchaeum sp. AArc-GB TaxID=3074078 RepID=UPI0028644E22|nr:hypothetical protein [Halalkaliarchaeum sp. AArc-GB]MDR5674630.1 hypothetical protein [Halalkaliarchaeum sp. AArc-GB]
MCASILGSADDRGPPKAEDDRDLDQSLDESGVQKSTSEEGESDPEHADESSRDVAELQSQSRQNGTELTKDELFDLLKNSRRRTVINYLRDNGGSANLSEVAEHIAALENDISVQELSSAQRKRVYIGLYQCHLPKMDDSGVVEYDKHRGSIELQDSVTQLLPYMESTDEDENDEDADRVYAEYITLGVAVCASVLVSAGAFGVGVFSLVSPTGWALFAAATLVGMALLQLYRW